tara:strand:- start:4057 stop:4377 length:321 start_codon:yes stop_codon:yes gene_type:complete
MSDLFLLEEFIKEALLDEAKRKRKKAKKKKAKKKAASKRGKNKKTKYPSQYQAHGKREKKLDKATELAKSSDPAERKRGYKKREEMERAERKKSSFKNVPRHDSKK